MRGLVVLAAGGRIAARSDLDAFVEQRNESGHFWMAVHELVSSHPYLCKRVAAIKELAAPGSVTEVGRSPFPICSRRCSVWPRAAEGPAGP